MEKIYDVVGLGELLVDFTTGGRSAQGNPVFEACPGGAVCNVLAMLCKLGRKTAFIGKVGDDQFGSWLRDTIEKIGIDSTGLLTDGNVPTTLAFVHTMPDGDREFSFYRNPGADMMLTEEETDYGLIRRARLFHFGTLSMTDEPARSATRKAVKAAREAGCLLSFDPNLRPPLWKSLHFAGEMMEYGFKHCDVLKISDDELRFASGMEDYDEGIRFLREKYRIPLIFLTLGKRGSRAYYKDLRIEKKGFAVKTVDATGAGDTFCGNVLHGILDKGIEKLTRTDLEDMLTSANAAAAIVAGRKGAILSMPEKSEVEELIKK